MIYFIKKEFHILKYQIKKLYILPILIKNDEIFIFNNNFFYENWNKIYKNELLEFILTIRKY